MFFVFVSIALGSWISIGIMISSIFTIYEVSIGVTYSRKNGDFLLSVFLWPSALLYLLCMSCASILNWWVSILMNVGTKIRNRKNKSDWNK